MILSGQDTRSYIRSAWLTLGAQVLLVALGFVTNILIARTIGPSGRGVVSIVFLFPFFLGMAFSFGIDEANVYFLGGKKARHGDLFANVLVVTLVGTALCCTLALMLRQYLLAAVL
jgi:O-antigen/teichoic acid export membrane protein